MKSCSLIDLEEDNRSEQAGTGAPSLLHQDLAALGEGGCFGRTGQTPREGGEQAASPQGEDSCL